jgi:hypothetical protein
MHGHVNVKMSGRRFKNSPARPVVVFCSVCVIYRRKCGRAAGIKVITEEGRVLCDVQYEAKETIDLSHKILTRLTVDLFLVTHKMYLGTQRTRRKVHALCTFSNVFGLTSIFVTQRKVMRRQSSLNSHAVRTHTDSCPCDPLLKMGLGEVWFLLGYIA